MIGRYGAHRLYQYRKRSEMGLAISSVSWEDGLFISCLVSADSYTAGLRRKPVRSWNPSDRTSWCAPLSWRCWGGTTSRCVVCRAERADLNVILDWQPTALFLLRQLCTPLFPTCVCFVNLKTSFTVKLFLVGHLHHVISSCSTLYPVGHALCSRDF